MLLSLLLGCAEPTAPAPTDFTPGVYTGAFTLEFIASFGPWESASERCSADLVLMIEPDHDVAPIRGRVYCETESLGVHRLDIQGTLEDFPEITGDLTSTERTDHWSGRFLDETRLAGELFGAVEQNGVTVEYTGTFMVCLDPDELPPGISEP